MTRGPIQLDVAVSYGLPRKGLPGPASFRKWIAATLETRILRADVGLRIVDAREGRSLNHHYRGKDYATNVLSFPAELPKGVKLPLLGDIVLCAPVVAREAREQHKPLIAHYAHLTIHGVLHLLGFDHQDEREAIVMETIERGVLATLGVADPYH
ncbi:MAG: rRNA maturation RNase YbeY [Proteobacteria bacterium]|nr:rRNA maturation RNase YbeY [Pseudomonadota bacterium]